MTGDQVPLNTYEPPSRQEMNLLPSFLESPGVENALKAGLWDWLGLPDEIR